MRLYFIDGIKRLGWKKGGLVLLGLGAWGGGMFWSDYSLKHPKHNKGVGENLAPHAVYLDVHMARGGLLCEVDGLDLKLANIDVNGDGSIESTLSYTNPSTNFRESVLIEEHEGQLLFRRYEVVGGEIRYLK